MWGWKGVPLGPVHAHTSFNSNSLDLFVSKEKYLYNLIVYCWRCFTFNCPKAHFPLYICESYNCSYGSYAKEHRSVVSILFLSHIYYPYCIGSGIEPCFTCLHTVLDCWWGCKSFISQWQSCAGIVVISILPVLYGMLSLLGVVLQWKW